MYIREVYIINLIDMFKNYQHSDKKYAISVSTNKFYTYLYIYYNNNNTCKSTILYCYKICYK